MKLIPLLSLFSFLMLFSGCNTAVLDIVRSSLSTTAVSSIATPAAGIYTAGNFLDITVNFTDVIEVNGSPRLPINVGGVNREAVYLSGSGTKNLIFRYTIQNGEVDLDGIEVQLPFNLNGGSLSSKGGFKNTAETFILPSVVIDDTAVSILSVTPPANSVYNLAADLDFSVQFSHPVTVGGVPSLPIDLGGIIVQANYVSGDGTDTLLFRYTTQQDDLDLNGISSDFPLMLNGGSLTSPGRTVSLNSNDTHYPGVIVDVAKLSILSVTPPANKTYRLNENIDITVTFSHNVTVGGIPRLPLIIGASTVYADYFSGGGTSSLVFRYTVLAGDYDTDGITLDFPLDPNGGSLSNTFRVTDYSYSDSTPVGVLVDARDLVITSITPQADGVYSPPSALSFTLNLNDNATVTGSPYIPLQIGGSTVNAVYAGGSGSSSLIFSYTLQNGDSDSDGVTLDFPLNFNGGSITAVGKTTNLAYTDQNYPGVLVVSNFVYNWPFTAGTDNDYVFDSSLIGLTSGNAELVPAMHMDQQDSALGFGGGVKDGVVWDANFIRLNQTGTLTNRSELSANWTPLFGNLVGHWKLNGLGSITDGATITATLGSNGVASNTDGLGMSYVSAKMFEGINFDGTDDYIEIPYQVTSAPTGGLTVSTWFKLDAFPGSGHISLVSKTESGGYGLIITTDTIYGCPANSLCFVAYISGSWRTVSVTRTNIALNEWYHLTGTFDGSNGRLYLNAKEVGTAFNVAGAISYSVANSLCLGADAGVGTCEFPPRLDGQLDEVALWNVALSEAQLIRVFNRQRSRFSGSHISRVFDGFAASSNWTDLAWLSTLPFFKELPDFNVSVQNESSATYSSLVGSTGSTSDNNLMNGNIGLWHLNEPAGTTGVGSILDKSGYGHHGEPRNNAKTGVVGVLNRAMQFDGIDDSLRIPYTATLAPTAAITVAAWVNFNNTTPSINETIASKTQDGAYSLYILNGSDDGLCLAYNLCFKAKVGGSYVGVNYPLSNLRPNRWYHVAGTYDGSNFRLYVNGVSVAAPVPAVGAIEYTSNNPLCLGAEASTSNCNSDYLGGQLDEVAIWNRALHASEVQQLYRRGANRLVFQVRNCINADCSDDPLGANWKGPDGTNTSFFSELNNNSSPLNQNGYVLKNAPFMTFSSFTNPVSTSRYFQYRMILESEDTGSSCNYGSGATWCSPELQNVQLTPFHYPLAADIVGKNGVNYFDLTNFVESLGASCPGGIGYNLGVGATYGAATWYWWDSAANAGAGGWVSASGIAQSNSAAAVASNISSFATQVGTGTVYFKAYLKSSGTTACELNDLQLNGVN